MSDFTSEFWSIFVAVVTIISIAACAFVLWKTSTMTVLSDNEDGTSGHVWDEDIREMNNPLPRWWVGMFWITIFYAVVYLIVYPGLGSYAGTFGWSQADQHKQEVDVANKALKPLYDKFAAMPVAVLAANPEAQAIGERLFMNNCAQCHGSDARGSIGFPNLTDHDWLYGGSPEKIKETITNGRNGMMPPMAAMVGSTEDVKNVANYVLSISGGKHNADSAALGKAKFVGCAACHGPEGAGNQAIGAPNLTDNTWLHGGSEAAIIKRINEGKISQMPAQDALLSPEQIDVLTAYIWGLSNQEN